MPSITRLLNRKKLSLASPAEPPPQKPAANPAPEAVPPPFSPRNAPADPTRGSLTSKSAISWDTRRIRSRPAASPPHPPEETTSGPPPEKKEISGIQLAAVPGPDAPDAGFELTSGTNQKRTAQSAAAIGASVGLKVQPARRARRQEPSRTQLTRWEAASLRQKDNNLLRVVAEMHERGAVSALFLAPLTSSGASLPQFEARAGFGSDQRVAIWQGWKWDTALTPLIWNAVSKSGVMEIAPQEKDLGASLRVALGVEKDEWLLLVRTGTTSSCSGVLAFTAKKSLQPNFVELRPLFSSVPVTASGPASEAA